jgi:hypothetical protein
MLTFDELTIGCFLVEIEDEAIIFGSPPDFEKLKREYPILFYAMGVIAEERIIVS